MIEYVTDAIVLDSKTHRESDGLLWLFTKQFGLVEALATGLRKITSRLSGHVKPLDRVTVRLVLKNRFRLTAALKTGSLPKTPESLRGAHLLTQLLVPGEPDLAIWRMLANEHPPLTDSPSMILKLSGFDPEMARCELCHLPRPTHFSPIQAFYLCPTCYLQSGMSAVAIA